MDRTENLKNSDSRELSEEAVKLLLEKKAIDVKMFEVSEYTSITDYYVNATGRSSLHVSSLADDIAQSFTERSKPPYRIEGKRANSWILVDFGSVIVNVFDSESRSFYNFDRLLPAECFVDIEPLVNEVGKKFS